MANSTKPEVTPTSEEVIPQVELNDSDLESVAGGAYRPVPICEIGDPSSGCFGGGGDPIKIDPIA